MAATVTYELPETIELGRRPVDATPERDVTARRRRDRATLVAVLVVVAIPAVVSAQSDGANESSSAARGHPRIVYLEKDRMTSPRRLDGSTVSRRVAVAVSWPNLVREVAFEIDAPAGSDNVFAIDRAAPFEVPKRTRAGVNPYGFGPHRMRASVELRTGRKIVLQAAYTVARSLEVGPEIDADSLQRAIGSAPAGPLLVRPKAGTTSFSVAGSFFLDRPAVVIERAKISGTVEFRPNASGSMLRGSSALGFYIFGADNVTLERNTFDGQGVRRDTIIWDDPAGNTPDGWVIRGNIFRNFYTSDPEDHTQAIYVGYSTNGLIEGNTFTKNGTTSHIFFTWFGNQSDPRTSYPRNICVRGNVFNETAGAIFDVNYRAEIPESANIRIQRDASGGGPFYGRC